MERRRKDRKSKGKMVCMGILRTNGVEQQPSSSGPPSLSSALCHSSLKDSEIRVSAASNCYIFPKLYQPVIILSVVKVTIALEHGMLWEMNYPSNARKRGYDASTGTDTGVCSSHG